MSWAAAEYLAMENSSPIKHEFLGGEVYAMPGPRPWHNRIATNTAGALVALVRGTGCSAFNSDQRIHIPASGLYTYSDGGVVCGKWEIHTDGMCLLNPVVLFEVLSPSTREYDSGAKVEHYQQIPSLRHLLLIDQPDRAVVHYWRASSETPWARQQLATGQIALAALGGGTIAVEDLYPSGDAA